VRFCRRSRLCGLSNAGVRSGLAICREAVVLRSAVTGSGLVSGRADGRPAGRLEQVHSFAGAAPAAGQVYMLAAKRLICHCKFSPRCRHHHHAKQAPGWQLTQHQPGYHTWTTPSGRQYTTGPTTYPI
jgi:hypothetical protein